MSLIDFVKKQFIDVIEWIEDADNVIAWRYPMQDREIQNGASLTVRESQMAVFVNEGKVADVFGPGRYKLTTQTLPVLTNLQNWDKLFQSPFKSDLYFFSTRQQLDQRWGTSQPLTLRDKEFGAIRVRAFGNYSFQLVDAKLFHVQVSGTRSPFTLADLQGQLLGLVLQQMSTAVAASGIAFLDLAANQNMFAKLLSDALAAPFKALGLQLVNFTVQSVSLPEELQKVLDQRIGMGMVGSDMQKFIQYQTGQAIPKMAEGAAAGGSGGGSIAGDAMGLGAGVAMGQVLAQNLAKGLAGGGGGGAASDEVMATLEKLHALKTKGVLTDAEYEAKKSELLKKLG